MTEATPLRLFNSLTRATETFQPVHPGEARVYTCGPTVYNYPHIGNMRAYVFADTLGRVLSWKGYKLTHVINITDVGHLTDDADSGEDKLEKAAIERAQSIWDIAKHYTEAYWDDVKALNIRQPAHWTIATDYVPQMIEFAESIAAKHCYQIDSGLYFDVTTVPDYGRLARARTEEGESRIDPVPGKRNPQDFAIWRTTPPGERRQMEWDSPWGRGAPGWHLECSVMSGAVLGFPFDIHTGGIDHREIHHPCEIAQNQAHEHSADSGARIWMHGNFLVDRRGKDGTGKMSKSSGEFLRLKTLVDRGFHPLSYRMMCLQAHYRSELEFTWEGLLAAQTRLKRLVRIVSQSIDTLSDDAKASLGLNTDNKVLKSDLISILSRYAGEQYAGFCIAVQDDLNTADALAAFQNAIDAGSKGGRFVDDNVICAKLMDPILGLDLLDLKLRDLRVRPATATLTEADIEAALDRRQAARQAKDFATSDAIRDELIAQGVEVMDGDPLRWDWKPVID